MENNRKINGSDSFFDTSDNKKEAIDPLKYIAIPELVFVCVGFISGGLYGLLLTLITLVLLVVNFVIGKKLIHTNIQEGEVKPINEVMTYSLIYSFIYVLFFFLPNISFSSTKINGNDFSDTVLYFIGFLVIWIGIRLWSSKNGLVESANMMKASMGSKGNYKKK
jgi:uncharacterized membrane protein YhaH (DUF805 family)